MIFPIGDVNVKGGAKPFLTYSFIGLNILVFLYQLTLTDAQCAVFVNTYGVIPAEIVAGKDFSMSFTSMFLHGGFMHLIGNMLFLWVFADNIEAVIGNIKFALFYFLGGLAAVALQTLSNPSSVIPMVGASGAISACLGAYLVMFPKSKIKILVVFLFSSFNIGAIYFLGLWIAQQFIAGIGSIAKTADTGGVAYWAHIGGFAFGVLAGLFFKRRGALKKS